MKVDTETKTDEQDVPMTDASTGAAASTAQSLPSNRFDLELEFVQSLASPAYLHYLATSGVLYQSSFLDFLRYLRYWKRPEYAKYLVYPNCLYFLDLLVPPEDDDETGETNNDDDYKEQTAKAMKKSDSGEAFRREMAQVQFRNFVHEQQFYSWQFRSARLYGRGEATKEEVEQDGKEEEENKAVEAET